MPKYIVEVTVFDAIGYKLYKEYEKTLTGLSQVVEVLKEPDKVETALYQLAIKLGIAFVEMYVKQNNLPIIVEPLYSQDKQNVLLGFRLVSRSIISSTVVDEVIQKFLKGFGEALRPFVESAAATS